MKIVEGAYASAKIFTDNVEDYALAQIQMLCDNAAFKESKIRIMPDVHPGKVGTIGFTARIACHGEGMTKRSVRILPNVVGVDIGCGVTLATIKQRKVEFQKLDKVIREGVPSGTQIRKKPHRFVANFDSQVGDVEDGVNLLELHCVEHVNLEKAELSIGTLGGGNHFIELDKGEEGTLYVAIHSGSRRLGGEVTEYYLSEGQKVLKKKGLSVPYELTYLEDALLEAYLHDVEVVQRFAKWNRAAILDELARGMKWKVEECFSVSHNYIECCEGEVILRKGEISARKGEPVVIPINMRDGILLGEGRGNEDWNYSAPHGAGRKIKRVRVVARADPDLLLGGM